jgi:hypothetical protein
MYTDLHVKYQLFLSDFNETSTFTTIFKKTNIKFHGNPPGKSRVVPRGHTDRRTDMTKLIVSRFSQLCERA